MTIFILFQLLYGFSTLSMIQQLKRKNETEDYEAESSEWTTSLDVVGSPLQEPASAKGVKGQKKASRFTKCNRSRPQTPPISNVGEFDLHSSSKMFSL